MRCVLLSVHAQDSETSADVIPGGQGATGAFGALTNALTATLDAHFKAQAAARMGGSGPITNRSVKYGAAGKERMAGRNGMKFGWKGFKYGEE